MVQATGFHRDKRLCAADIDDVRQVWPLRNSTQPRRPIFRLRHDPHMEMLECAIRVAAASHMPKPVLNGVLNVACLVPTRWSTTTAKRTVSRTTR